MKKLLVALWWLAIGVMVATPTVWRYGFSDQMTWLCTKDGEGELDGTCRGEQTLYHRLGYSKYWDRFNLSYPRIDTMPIVGMDDIEHASPSQTERGSIELRPTNSCWNHYRPGHIWCEGQYGYREWQVPATYDASSRSASQLLAARFNSFRNDPHQRTFRHMRPRPFLPWHAALYAAAALLTIVSFARMKSAPTRAWLAAIADIPATPKPRTPYRG